MYTLKDKFGKLPDCEYEKYGEALASARIRAKRQRRAITIYKTECDGEEIIVEVVGTRFLRGTNDG